MFRKSLLLGAALLFMPPAATQAQDLVGPMQQCQTNADCVITENRCGTNCEATPINRAYINEFAAIAGGICAIEVQPGMVCATPMTLEPACVAGVCTVQTAQIIAPPPAVIAVPPSTAPDYEALAQGITEELRFAVPADDREGWFTAYDLPPQIVEMDRLGQVYIIQR